MNISLYYDFISLGYKCETALYLKNQKLRINSYPFDWCITMSLKTINNILSDDNFTKNYLDNIINFSNNRYYLKYFGASKNVKNLMYISKNYKGLIFRHFDLIENQNEREKIKRRLLRFKNRLNNEKPIIFIRYLHDGNVNIRLKKSNIDIDYILDDMNNNKLFYNINIFFDILQKKFNRYNDKLIIINNNNYNFEHKNVIFINNFNDIKKIYKI